MKVLIIASSVPRYKNDTWAPFVLDLAKQLVIDGVKISIVCPHDKGAKKYEVIEGVKIYRFKYFFPDSAQKLCYGAGMLPNIKSSWLAKIQVPFFLMAETIAILKVVRKEKPDVINAHWIIPQGLIAAILRPFIGGPLIMTAHGSDLYSFRTGIKRKIVKFGLDRADAITVNSSSTLKVVEEDFQIDSAEVIPMGVNTKKFGQNADGSKFRQKYKLNNTMLLIVGRLIEVKGIKYAVKAMPTILKKNPEAKLVIVGDGPEQRKLEKLADSLGIRNSIIFTGRQPANTMNEIFAAADIYIQPSIEAEDGGAEGLGVVILEALATGVPVVATETGGIVDIVESNKHGLLIPQKNSSAIAKSTNKMLEDKELTSKFRSEGREFVEKNYSWNVIAERFSALYINQKSQ